MRQLTQAELADRAGVSVNYISELERGLRNPTLLTFHRIAAAGLGADPGEVLAPPSTPHGAPATYPTTHEPPSAADRAADRSAHIGGKMGTRVGSVLAGTTAADRRRLRAVLRALADVLR